MYYLIRAKVWRAVRYVNCWVGTTVEPWTARECNLTHTSLQNEEMLKRECFPPNDDDKYFKLPPARCSHTPITDLAFEWSLYFQSVKKALGPDMLTCSTIKLCWMWDKKMIVRLTKVAILMGRHPAVWEQASGVVICKPCNDDYTQLKAYRSISLLSCMGHVVEGVVTELPSADAKRRGLLGDRQFGSRTAHSAIDTQAIMVDRPAAAWNNGDITDVLLMDTKAVFPSVAKQRLLNLMKVRQKNGNLVRWTECCLSERREEMIIKRNAMARHPVED